MPTRKKGRREKVQGQVRDKQKEEKKNHRFYNQGQLVGWNRQRKRYMRRNWQKIKVGKKARTWIQGTFPEAY